MEKMKSRQKQLLELKSYLQTVDSEVTMVLQSLQWDQKGLLEGTSKVTCQYDTNHKVPSQVLTAHEDKCQLRKLGYSVEDLMLPDAVDENAVSFIKYNMTEIQQIINNAAQKDPLFKRGCTDQNPLTAERMQTTYTADERRAIYNAIIEAAPSCNDLSELDLPSTSKDDQRGASNKTRLEILAELRDMKRRRTKYRVAAKTKNYSHVLRDVIKTQMEVYSEVHGELESTTADMVSGKTLNITKDKTSFISNSSHTRPKETKLGDVYAREKQEVKYHIDGSRERHAETRTSSECRRHAHEDRPGEGKRRSYEDKHRKSKQREERYAKEKDKYYNTDRKSSNREKRDENKYDGRYRQSEWRSSRDGSRDGHSYRDRGSKTNYVKEENGEHGGSKHKSDKEEKYKRYYDTFEREKTRRTK